MSTAITIPNDIPSPELEIVSLALVTRHQALLAQASYLPAITTTESAAVAELVLMDLSEIEKQIQSEVDRRSKPAHQLHKAIIAVGNKALEPIQLARSSLRGRIGAWNREQQRLRDEALAKADAERKAAEAAAEKERQRLQAEADAKHAAEVAAAEAVRKKAQDEANVAAEVERARLQAIADEEAKELADMLGSAPVVEAVKVAAPVIAAPVVAAAVVVKVEIAAPVTVVPPVVKSSVIQRMVPKLVIDDAKLVPVFMGGEVLRKLDEAAIKRAIEAGHVVPGAHIEMVPSDAMRSVRP